MGAGPYAALPVLPQAVGFRRSLLQEQGVVGAGSQKVPFPGPAQRGLDGGGAARAAYLRRLGSRFRSLRSRVGVAGGEAQEAALPVAAGHGFPGGDCSAGSGGRSADISHSETW